MNGTQLLTIHINRTMYQYLTLVEMRHGFTGVLEVQAIVERMIAANNTITNPALFTEYLESVQVPDVDHSQYWLLGLDADVA